MLFVSFWRWDSIVVEVRILGDSKPLYESWHYGQIMRRFLAAFTSNDCFLIFVG